MPSQELNLEQMLDRKIPARIKNKETLHGLAEIACYMERSITTIRRLIKNYGLPAHRPGGRSSSYFTTKANIKEWVQQGHLRQIEQHNWDKRLMHR